MSELGEFITEHRLDQKLSIRKLARITNLSPTEICRLENGIRKHPSPLVLKAIAEALGTTFEAIMRAAGYLDKASSGFNLPIPFSGSCDLSEQELEEVRDFIDFLIAKRRERKC